MKVLIIYIILVNIYGIYIMYVDKKRAKEKKWRVPEIKMFLVAVFLGSVGIILGMKFFRHKTKHFKFVYGMPLVLFIQVYTFYKILL